MLPDKKRESFKGMYNLKLSTYDTFFQVRSGSDTESGDENFESDIDAVIRSVLEN